jgi:hypothetical protein
MIDLITKKQHPQQATKRRKMKNTPTPLIPDGAMDLQ